MQQLSPGSGREIIDLAPTSRLQSPPAVMVEGSGRSRSVVIARGGGVKVIYQPTPPECYMLASARQKPSRARQHSASVPIEAIARHSCTPSAFPADSLPDNPLDRLVRPSYWQHFMVG